MTKSTQADIRLLLDLHARKIVDDTYVVKQIKPGQLNEILHPIIDFTSVKGLPVLTGGITGAPGAAIGRVFFSTEGLLEAHKIAQQKGQDTKLILCLVVVLRGGREGNRGGHGRPLHRGRLLGPRLGRCPPVREGVPGEARHEDQGQPRHHRGAGHQGRGLHHPERPVLRRPVDVPRQGGAHRAGSRGIGHAGFPRSWWRSSSPGSTCAPTRTSRATPPWRASSGPRASASCARSTCSSTRSGSTCSARWCSPTPWRSARRPSQRLLPMQKADFYKLLKIMEGYPVIIRLLDAPLHEFLPHNDQELERFMQYLNAGKKGASARLGEGRAGAQRGAARVQPHARPPRLPHRGLLSRDLRDAGAGHLRGRVHPQEGRGARVEPEMMIPIIMNENELKIIIYGKKIEGKHIRGLADIEQEVRESFKAKPAPYKIGTMVELPAAALGADQLAHYAAVLLLRDERPDADDHRALAGRLQRVHAGLHPVRPPGRQPVPVPEPAGAGADRARGEEGTG